MANHLKMAKAQAMQALGNRLVVRRIARTLRISRVTVTRMSSWSERVPPRATGFDVQSRPNPPPGIPARSADPNCAD